jgi:hypothetical protein
LTSALVGGESNKGVNIGNQGRKSHEAIILEEVVMLVPNNYKELCFPPCFMLVSCLAYSSTLNMEVTCSSETSVDFQ